MDFSSPHTAFVATPQVRSLRRRGRAWVITLGDDLRAQDLSSVRETVEGCTREKGAPIVIDAGAVTAADQSLIELLTAASGRAPVCVAAPSPAVRRLMGDSGGRCAVLSASCLGEALDVVGM